MAKLGQILDGALNDRLAALDVSAFVHKYSTTRTWRNEKRKARPKSKCAPSRNTEIGTALMVASGVPGRPRGQN